MDKQIDWNDMTIAEARTWLRGKMDQGGASCPCCKQHVEIYRRALNGTIARWLIWLVRSFEITIAEIKLTQNDEPNRDEIWIEARRSGATGGDYGKLLHWRLAKQKEGKDGLQGRGSGLWQPTQKGIDLAHGRIEIPSHVRLYNGRVLGFSETMISIQAAVGGDVEYKLIWSRPISVGAA